MRLPTVSFSVSPLVTVIAPASKRGRPFVSTKEIRRETVDDPHAASATSNVRRATGPITRDAREALTVSMAAEVDGEPIDEERDVGAVVGIEPAQEILLGLAATLMLADHEPGNEAQDVGRPALRAKLEVAPGDEDLGRRGDRRRRRHHDGRQD